MDVIDALEAKIAKVEKDIEAVEGQIATCTDKETLVYLRDKEKQLRDEKKQLRDEKKQLRDEKNQLLEKELILLRNAAATTVLPPGPSSGAPAPRRLVDSVAELHYKNNDIVELQFSDSSKVSYVDVAGMVVNRIRLWAVTAMANAVDKRRGRAPSPLLVSGLVKTGKSITLEYVVPAVMAEVLRQKGGEGPFTGMVVLRLNGVELQRQDGATAMLRSLLEELLSWVHDEHVPMREGALEAAEAAKGTTSLSLLGLTIRKFLKAVEVPVLVLCDEVQNLFLPTFNGKLDVSGAAYIRDTFMKPLLLYGSNTMLWCMTGSSMAQTWISLANMPPNGYPLITGSSAVHLPATYSPEHMSLAWELLKGSKPHVELDPKLLELCPPSIALLTFLVDDWIDEAYPRDVAAFVHGFMRTKLIDESLKEWKLGLEGMPLSQRLTVLDLAFPDVGARIDTELHPGLRRFLEPHLDRKDDGRYYFRDSYQRQIVRLLFNKDGTLRESWSSLKFSATIMQLDTSWNLLRLGEAADNLLEPQSSRWWEHEKPPAGLDEFTAKLQAIADKAATKLASDQGGVVGLGPQELWERQSWFQKVLSSKWNDRDRAKAKGFKQARCSHLAMLVFYLRLSRNVLAHAKPWDQEYDIPVDVNVIEVLPRVLGQSLFDFNEDIVDALRVLSRHNMEGALAKIHAQPSGSGGSSIEVLTNDEGSSDGISGAQRDGSSGAQCDSFSGAQRDSSSGTQHGGSSGAQHGGSSGARRDGSSGAQRDGSSGAQRDGSSGAQCDGSSGPQHGGSSGAQHGGSSGAPRGGSSGARRGGSSGARRGGSSGAGRGGSSGAGRGGSSGAGRGGSSGAGRGGSSGAGRGGSRGAQHEGSSGTQRDGSNGTQHDGSSGAQHGGNSGAQRGSSRGVMAMPDKCPGLAAGCGQHGPLVNTTGRHGVWGQGGLRAATLAPRLHVKHSLFAPSAAKGLRLPW
ncbi:hypothetical protein Vretimale_2913 [Volvox reticuliferus]|uniref:Uncharacterized protein n=1 Tax=Volvox reticuliferus TaxID=1737510 RepID=A0A8J4D8R8_9CHLO|nr:hypothetical protein Vretifemale_6897 [Volvox reticuliferus]GIL97256.1 hypothetical protein Vretimale_2913 [Volvox reticuliferus]